MMRAVIIAAGRDTRAASFGGGTLGL